MIEENLMLTQALNKLERKHKRQLKKEYERGWNEAMMCKKGIKRLCSVCRKKLSIERGITSAWFDISSRAGNNKGE
ncbi:MAG: hypothetical protein LC127_06275, partial [Chitinophagales bacterium]|nr:hypothetical protein [Chitinophagales bacterium]